MKLRIRGNAIRLRLTKPEVAAFAERGLIEDATSFPNGKLRYALEFGPRLSASFSAATGIVITVPREQGRAWCTSDDVGIGGEDGPTSLLIEKDWSCVKPREDEDPVEMYPHPRAK